MDTRLSAVGLIAVTATDNPFVFGRIELPWFGAPKTVDVIFERANQDEPPNDRQIEAFCRFASKLNAFFEALEKKLFQYFNDARKVYDLDKDTIERLFPHLENQRQLRALVDLTGLLVSYYDGEPWCDYIGLLLECSWEREHGLGIKVVDEQVREIGRQDIVL